MAHKINLSVVAQDLVDSVASATITVRLRESAEKHAFLSRAWQPEAVRSAFVEQLPGYCNIVLVMNLWPKKLLVALPYLTCLVHACVCSVLERPGYILHLKSHRRFAV